MSDNEQRRPSIPGVGNSLARATETRAIPVRTAANLVETNLALHKVGKDFEFLFGARWALNRAEGTPIDFCHRAAWALLATWLVGRIHDYLPPAADLTDAEEWFWEGVGTQTSWLSHHLGTSARKKLTDVLNSVIVDNDLSDLLPYILDPIGPASRLDVMRDPTVADARSTRRQKGIFYTPSDVAEYIAGGVIARLPDSNDSPRLLDPACGSGVFLRAALAHLPSCNGDQTSNRFTIAQNSLYGIDISPQAVEAAAFVLLNDTIKDAAQLNLKPWAAWHLLRMNFAHTDAVALERPTPQTFELSARRHEQQTSLFGGCLPDMSILQDAPSQTLMPLFFNNLERRWPSISCWFPEASDGFDAVLGNPPYATLGERTDWDLLAQSYDNISAPCKASDDLYPIFIEMTWRYTKLRCRAAGMVVPLSIAYQRQQQYRNCRAAMSRVGGKWEFAFFDREPHALFGEEVKTRNSIFFGYFRDTTSHTKQSTEIAVTNLIRWTSRTRHELFENLKFQDLGSIDITDGIPKVSGVAFIEALNILRNNRSYFYTSWAHVNACEPSGVFQITDRPTVFVASTAYNFLNVLRPHPVPSDVGKPLSKNKLYAISFATESDANAAFAFLSSRLIYWWWHVVADGFHVPLWFLETLPFSFDQFTDCERSQLAELGKTMWSAVQHNKIVSINRGRATVAYRPFLLNGERDEVDRVLLRHAGLGEDLLSHLKSFVSGTVLVDVNDDKRRVTHNYICVEEFAL